MCGLDSDGDGFPDVQLDCTGPQCEQVPCMHIIHNKSTNKIAIGKFDMEYFWQAKYLFFCLKPTYMYYKAIAIYCT